MNTSPNIVFVSPIVPESEKTPVSSTNPKAIWSVTTESRGGITHGVFSEAAEAGRAVFASFQTLSSDGSLCTLKFRDDEETISAITASDFVDRLAEALWDCIDREEAEPLPSHPEEYGPLADGHPIDELRFHFAEAAGIL